jgi:ubiquinone/menaquinone biosynthesis C-methylase UbiE
VVLFLEDSWVRKQSSESCYDTIAIDFDHELPSPSPGYSRNAFINLILQVAYLGNILSRESRQYFEDVSGSWDALRSGFYGDEVRDAVLAAARLLPEHTVLDVGAGTGFLAEGAAKIARKVIALDFSEAMLSEARAKLGGRNVEFKIGNVEQIPLPNASIDAVIGNMVLHHCQRPEIAVKEMARVLVPGGRLVLSDLQEHNHESLRKEHADLWMGFKMDYVQMTLQKAGLDDVSVEALGSCCSETKENGQITIPTFLAAGHKPW